MANKKAPELRFKSYTQDWELCKFSSFVSRRSETSDSTKLPKVEFADIIAGEGRLNKDVSKKFDNRRGILFNSNNILYGKLRPYLKNWLLPNFSGIALGDFWVFEPINMDKIFLYYLLQAEKFQKIANDTTGTKMPRSDWKKVSNSEFLIPEYEEQVKIGKFLEKVDFAIALHQRKLEQLELLKKAYFQQLFPEKDKLIPKTRFSGFNSTWKKCKLQELVDEEIKGKAQAGNLKPGNVEYLDTARLNGGIPFLTDEKQDVSKNDVIILWDGSKAGTVYTGFEGVLGSTLKAYKTNGNSQFIFQYLTWRQDNIYNNYRTPNIPHVLKDFLEIFKITTPSMDEQLKISIYLSKYDLLINYEQQKIDQIASLKQAYLQKMFI